MGHSTTTCPTTIECAAGYYCNYESGNNVCRRWCRLGHADCTAGGTTCTSVGPVVVDGVTWGLCL
jgi:hypothetical protein